MIKIQSINLNNKKILIVMDEESDRSDFFGFRRNWNFAIPICPPKLNPSLGGDNRSRSNAVWRNFSKYSNSGNGNYFLINKICIHGFHEFFCAYDIEIKLKIKSDSFIYPIWLHTHLKNIFSQIFPLVPYGPESPRSNIEDFNAMPKKKVHQLMVRDFPPLQETRRNCL